MTPTRIGPLFQEDSLWAFALGTLGILTWSTMDIIGMAMDTENPDGGVGAFDAWIANAQASPGAPWVTAWPQHATCWQLLIFLPIASQALVWLMRNSHATEHRNALSATAVLLSLLTGLLMVMASFSPPSTVALSLAVCGILAGLMSTHPASGTTRH